MRDELSKTLKQLPSVPGVYFFKDSNEKIIYIGKAANLRSRVSSYFRATANLSAAKATMLEKIADIGWQICDSAIEALVLEARLIKQHKPRYNVALRDDKNYFFVSITKEEWPRLSLTHQTKQIKGQNVQAEFIGPFTDGKAVKNVLKMLRKIFPFKTCKNPLSKPCFYYHLSLCPAHNPAPDAQKKYSENLKQLKNVLKGKNKSVLNGLKKKMREAAMRQNFEKAAELRDQSASLEKIFSHRGVISQNEELSTTKKDFQKISKQLKIILNIKANEEIERLECYDISNIQGKFAVGSMIVFFSDDENFKPKESNYRKFKIKTLTEADDPAMLAEILTRRFQHKEWSLPQLIILDGGRGQLNAGKEVLKNNKLKIPICALAKKEEELYIPDRKNPIPLKTLPREILFLFQRIRDEAHRFAVSYHRVLRSRAMIAKKLDKKIINW